MNEILEQLLLELWEIGYIHGQLMQTYLDGNMSNNFLKSLYLCKMYNKDIGRILFNEMTLYQIQILFDQTTEIMNEKKEEIMMEIFKKKREHDYYFGVSDRELVLIYDKLNNKYHTAIFRKNSFSFEISDIDISDKDLKGLKVCLSVIMITGGIDLIDILCDENKDYIPPPTNFKTTLKTTEERLDENTQEWIRKFEYKNKIRDELNELIEGIENPPLHHDRNLDRIGEVEEDLGKATDNILDLAKIVRKLLGGI